MKLYNFFRSGTSHRLRIALNLKDIATDYVAVDLRVEEHLKDAFKAVNPQQLVPALDTGEQVLIQSPAIIEWLEEKHPTPALLPTDVNQRDRSTLKRRALSICGIRYTSARVGVSPKLKRPRCVSPAISAS